MGEVFTLSLWVLRAVLLSHRNWWYTFNCTFCKFVFLWSRINPIYIINQEQTCNGSEDEETLCSAVEDISLSPRPSASACVRVRVWMDSNRPTNNILCQKYKKMRSELLLLQPVFVFVLKDMDVLCWENLNLNEFSLQRADLSPSDQWVIGALIVKD